MHAHVCGVCLSYVTENSVVIELSNPFISATTDFESKSGILVTFAAGEMEQFVSVSITDDDIIEGEEQFTAVLEETSGVRLRPQTSTAMATISDNDCN